MTPSTIITNLLTSSFHICLSHQFTAILITLVLIIDAFQLVTTTTTTTAAMSADQLNAFRRAFIDRLGLTMPVDRAVGGQRPSVPDYVWDYYEAISTSRSGVPVGTDSIRQYYPETIEHNGDGIMLRYNLSHDDATEHYLRADLKLQLDGAIRRRKRVELYEMIDACHDVRRLIDTKLIDADDNALITLDATVALSRRRYGNQSGIVDLLIAIRHIGGNTTGYLISEHSSRPALIVYSMSTTTTGVRRRRDTSAPKRHHSGGGRKHNQKTGGQQQHRTAPPPVRQLCQRHSVYVDFSELNWQDWILAPNGYEAFYCDGACHYPLGGNHNVTNHAIVQSLVNSVSRNAAPPPCCVPTETEQLAILYIDINNRIIIKNYPEMKVIGCGCR